MSAETASNARKIDSTDPKVYDEYRTTWEEQPKTDADWIRRAKEVASVLGKDAGQRERDNRSPRAEIALLKHSGLLKVLGSQKYGGGEQPWSVGYHVIREVARGDGSIGMLLGYHLLWSTIARIVGTPAQAEHFEEVIISNNYFVSGAVNPRDHDLSIIREGEELIIDGFKFFNTGGVISDLTVLEGSFEGTSDHIFTVVKTDQPRIVFGHDWNNIGLRLTESGSVKINKVKVPWSDALGWDPEAAKPDLSILGIPYVTLLLPTIQLVFSNFYLGITWGALDAATAYTKQSTRAWPVGGDVKESATDEFYILSTYGNFFAHVRAATALADRAGDEITRVYGKVSNLDERSKVSAEERGEVSEWVASAKVVATDVGLRVTSGVFEVTGAKATASKVGLDRFWRDIRTHTLHDPVAYKNRELGRYQLLGELPTPTWYT
ncbi:hypothetical protein QQS21_001938 [Conoideocrella luteorostrata]|uniref:Thermophilic desulfurizing enzyme family protein n=1 Tax=Conoideocrella luteorostrata TaxID=1105319 RepID=A0AAJ0CWW1_9HYPO|nr:hypothetical protein QQS21_001938 [Conoideocrella luteorostrata]